MLELLAEGAEIHHSIELSLDRLGHCPQGSWTPDEQAALDRFALAYFEVVLKGDPLDESGRCRCFHNALSILLMFAIGRITFAPLLEFWLQCPHPSSTVEFVRSTYWDFWQQCEYSNPFASDRPEFREVILHHGRFLAELATRGTTRLSRIDS